MNGMARWTATLLKLARVTYVVAATVSILIAAIGLLVALYLQIAMTKGPDLVAVPPVMRPPLPDLSTVAVENRLEPPANLRVVVTRPVIDRPLGRDDVLGHFQADTFNGLAPYPEDVDILGGADAELFDRKPGNGRAASLVATPKLIERVNRALSADQPSKQLDFSLIVVARDAYGLMSAATPVTFALAYGQASTTASPDAPARQTEPSELELLARDIALIVAPAGSPAYERAHDRAVRQPEVCGAGASLAEFVMNYRKLFEYVRSRLTAANLPAFYDGVCESWRKALTDQASMLAESQAARYSAINANRAAELRSQSEAAGAWVDRNLTLVVAGSAFGGFLTVCFLLAFLAMENHSNAMRDALVALSEARRNDRETRPRDGVASAHGPAVPAPPRL